MIGRAHKRVAAFALAGCALACAVGLLAPPAADAAFVVDNRKVVVFVAPYLTWNDISPEKTPAIWSLLDNAALGNVDAHTAEWGAPTLAGGALTISASRWVKGPQGGPADAASLDRARAVNEGSLSNPTLGLLGSSLASANVLVATVGASDTDTNTDAGRLRPAELLAVDEDGSAGQSLADALVADPAAPFGLRTDQEKLNSRLEAALSGPQTGLVVVDVGDLSRAHDATAAPDVTRRRHQDAVRLLDQTVGELNRDRGPYAPEISLVMVVPVATDKEWYKAPAFGPLIIAGGNFRGRIVSASTRRPGLATNLDIAPTILAAYGREVPGEMLGKPLSSDEEAGSPAQLIAQLQVDNVSPGVIDQLRDAWVLTWFCYAAIAAVVLATILAFVPLGWAVTLAEIALIATLAALPAAWLMFLGGRQPLDVGSAGAAFGFATLLVTVAALIVRRVFSATRLAAPLFLTSLSSLVVLADQWTGRPIESGIFSYSVAAGWRFYGMGNEGAAILVGASIAAVALTTDILAEKPALHAAARRFGMPAVGLIVLVTSAAPFAGANVGVAVWGVIAYGIAWAAMNGIRLTWRTIGLTLLAVAVAVAAFAAFDLMGSSEGGSHLARFARGILGGDMAATVELVRRKLANNLAYLPQTNYTGLALAMTVSLALLWFVPSRPLSRALRSTPAYAGALLGLVVGALAAWATEDSGVVMPALMLFAGAGPALLITLGGALQAATPPPLGDSVEITS